MREATSTPTTPALGLSELLRLPPADHPDFSLIAACGAFLAVEKRVGAVLALSADDTSAEAATDEARSPLMQAQEPLLDAICAAIASSPAGYAARCHVLLACDRHFDPVRDARPGATTPAAKRLVAATVRDLVAGAVS